jgi:hypothetical protein
MLPANWAYTGHIRVRKTALKGLKTSEVQAGARIDYLRRPNLWLFVTSAAPSNVHCAIKTLSHLLDYEVGDGEHASGNREVNKLSSLEADG